MYTPNSIVQTETGRKILSWYIRFDLYSCYWTGGGSTIGLEWLYAIDHYYHDSTRTELLPSEVHLERILSALRIQGIEFGAAFVCASSEKDSRAALIEASKRIMQKIAWCKEQLEPFFSNTDKLVAIQGEETCADPNDPSSLSPVFIEPLWSANYIHLDLLVFEAMHRRHTAQFLSPGGDPSLAHLITWCCQVFESIERYPQAPPAAILPVQANLGMICLLVPHESRFLDWCCQKLANVECAGSVGP